MMIWYNRNLIGEHLEATVGLILSNWQLVTEPEGLRRLIIGLSSLFPSFSTLPANIQPVCGNVLATVIALMKTVIARKQDA